MAQQASEKMIVAFRMGGFELVGLSPAKDRERRLAYPTMIGREAEARIRSFRQKHFRV